MNKSTITQYLNKLNYDFTESGEIIKVKLDFSLEVIIDLSSTDKIKLNDKLGSMNFLSWPFSMSIKGTMLYNFISSIIVMILFLAIRNSTDNYVLTWFMIFVAFWNLYWLIYYLIKSENFKNEIKTLIR